MKMSKGLKEAMELSALSKKLRQEFFESRISKFKVVYDEWRNGSKPTSSFYVTIRAWGLDIDGNALRSYKDISIREDMLPRFIRELMKVEQQIKEERGKREDKW